MKNAWRLWCYALGEKIGKNNKEANTVAIIRTFIFLSYLMTNAAIIANAVRHWNSEINNQKSSVSHEIVLSIPRGRS